MSRIEWSSCLNYIKNGSKHHCHPSLFSHLKIVESASSLSHFVTPDRIQGSATLLEREARAADPGMEFTSSEVISQTRFLATQSRPVSLETHPSVREAVCLHENGVLELLDSRCHAVALRAEHPGNAPRGLNAHYKSNEQVATLAWQRNLAGNLRSHIVTEFDVRRLDTPCNIVMQCNVEKPASLIQRVIYSERHRFYLILFRDSTICVRAGTLQLQILDAKEKFLHFSFLDMTLSSDGSKLVVSMTHNAFLVIHNFNPKRLSRDLHKLKIPEYVLRRLSPAHALNEEAIERCRQSLLEDEARELRAWKERPKEHWEYYFQGNIQNRLEILRKDSYDFESYKLDLQHRRSVSLHPEAHCFVARVDSRNDEGVLCQKIEVHPLLRALLLEEKLFLHDTQEGEGIQRKLYRSALARAPTHALAIGVPPGTFSRLHIHGRSGLVARRDPIRQFKIEAPRFTPDGRLLCHAEDQHLIFFGFDKDYTPYRKSVLTKKFQPTEEMRSTGLLAIKSVISCYAFSNDDRLVVATSGGEYHWADASRG